MSDRATLLFELPQYRVLAESSLKQGGCPACGVLSGVIKDRPVSRARDLPHGHVPLLVFVRKLRLACTQVADVPLLGDGASLLDAQVHE